MKRDESESNSVFPDAHLIPTKDHYNADDQEKANATSRFFFPLCPQGEALCGERFSYPQRSMRISISQSIMGVYRSQIGACIPVKSATQIMKFCEDCNVLFSRFIVACHQVFNTKTQNLRKLFFRLLGYRYISAPRGKLFSVNVERLRVRLMRELCRVRMKLKWKNLTTLYGQTQLKLNSLGTVLSTLL